MSDSNNHIKMYAAQDIDRYLNGKMSPAEMHALEKAALDDPFLAEAIEGYVNTRPVSVAGDINAMANALDAKTGARVIGMNFKRIAWSAAAAVILLVGVTSTWVWLRPSTQNSIAQQKERSLPPAQQDNLKVLTDSVNPQTMPVQQEPAVVSSPGRKTTSPAPLPLSERENAEEIAAKKDNFTAKQGFSKNKNLPASEDEVAGLQSSAPENLSTAQKRTTIPRQGDLALATEQAQDQKAVRAFSTPNIFTGTITDNNKKPLPFVNISIANTPASTYSDAKGNFRLASADTQLVVHLKSAGFEEKEVALTSAQPVNVIQLQPHSNALNEVVVTGYGTQKKRNTAANADLKKKAEEKDDDAPGAEPKDGWAAYDVYMMNNTKSVFSDPGSTLKGFVELSFTVNKNGMLTDFNVEKSTCPLCNKEAVRLVKEGPQWKLIAGGDTARVTLTMQF